MESFTECKTRVIEYLSGLTPFADAVVVPSYTEKAKAFPLKKPVISVEISGAELGPSGFGNYLGGDSPQYGMTALITLTFGIHHTNAENCGKLFESLLDALFSSPIIHVQEIRRKQTTYDTKTAACLLYAEAAIKAVWLAGENGERLFENVILKNLEEQK